MTIPCFCLLHSGRHCSTYLGRSIKSVFKTSTQAVRALQNVSWIELEHGIQRIKSTSYDTRACVVAPFMQLESDADQRKGTGHHYTVGSTKPTSGHTACLNKCAYCRFK
jgi:hypothetical protein